MPSADPHTCCCSAVLDLHAQAVAPEATGGCIGLQVCQQLLHRRAKVCAACAAASQLAQSKVCQHTAAGHLHLRLVCFRVACHAYQERIALRQQQAVAAQPPLRQLLVLRRVRSRSWADALDECQPVVGDKVVAFFIRFVAGHTCVV
jgi:hypothetical protein